VFYLSTVYFIWALMIPETQVTCFRFGTVTFAQNVLLKTVKSNYTSVRFVVFGYMLLVFVPLRFLANLDLLYIHGFPY